MSHTIMQAVEKVRSRRGFNLESVNLRFEVARGLKPWQYSGNSACKSIPKKALRGWSGGNPIFVEITLIVPGCYRN